MKFQYLGTAAAEGIPAIYCRCDVCVKSRRLGGRNIRTRSQALVDGKLLIDYNADTFCHFQREGLDLTDVKDVIITHVHGDHFYTQELSYLREGYAHVEDGYKVTVYGSEDVVPELSKLLDKTSGRLEIKTVSPFETFEAAGLSIKPVPAVHGTPHPYLYVISDGKKKIFYCHDSGIPRDEVFANFKASGDRFDMVSIDCTGGANESLGYDAHMCLGYAEIVREKLFSIGAADDNTVFVLNHFSHNGLSVVYDDFKLIREKRGFMTSYDGMVLDI